jgi:hypothetical protein
MTAYVASTVFNIELGQGYGPALTVRAGSYEMKIARIDIGAQDASGDGDVIQPQISRYINSNPTGGSALTPQPLRQGAPSATATCRAGQLTVPGTGVILASLPDIPSGSQAYEPPFDCTVSPGSLIHVYIGWHLIGGGSIITAVVNVYFEELRLSWHY